MVNNAAQIAGLLGPAAHRTAESMSVIRCLPHWRVRRGLSTAAAFLGPRPDVPGGIETNGESPYRDVSVRRLNASIIPLTLSATTGLHPRPARPFVSSSVFRQRISGTVTSPFRGWRRRAVGTSQAGFRSRSPGLSGTPKAWPVESTAGWAASAQQAPASLLLPR